MATNESVFKGPAIRHLLEAAPVHKKCNAFAICNCIVGRYHDALFWQNNSPLFCTNLRTVDRNKD